MTRGAASDGEQKTRTTVIAILTDSASYIQIYTAICVKTHPPPSHIVSPPSSRSQYLVEANLLRINDSQYPVRYVHHRDTLNRLSRESALSGTSSMFTFRDRKGISPSWSMMTKEVTVAAALKQNAL